MVVLIAGCSMQRKLGILTDNSTSAMLTIAEEPEVPMLDEDVVTDRDTAELRTSDGVLIMNAVKDEDGEMVATDVIKAAMVVARFRNVAERHGKVDLRFRITVPKEMQDSKWQLRFSPSLYIQDDSTRLDSVIITGSEYRRRQLRGYEQYRKFLDSIISDTTKFINVSQLEIFIRRNIPELYKFRNDSSAVSDTMFASVYGVSEREAIEHYTNRFQVRKNNNRIRNTDKYYRKYVKVPLTDGGIRLDTVITDANGDIVYDYVQTINTRPGLRKAEIRLDGAIYEQDKRIYSIPRSEPITFYISSLSAFTDNSEHYLLQVIERRVNANTACYIDFRSGQSVIDETLSGNREEIDRIKRNICDLLANEVYDLDSIIVTASCSPEGQWKFNERLSQSRSESVSEYFGRYIKAKQDSIRLAAGFGIGLDGRRISNEVCDIDFISRSNPENWQMLDAMIRKDTSLTSVDKEIYFGLSSLEPDEREAMMGRQPFYLYLREHLYPHLRTVCFDFRLHRRGMVKDTVHTMVLDTAYMNGVQAIRDRDYAKAISILRPYHDFNLAVAYCAMDYNASAMGILKTLKENDKVCYMLALLYSRQNDYSTAVNYYRKAYGQNPSYRHRGNLDPEISLLIKRYGLFGGDSAD